MKRALVLTSVFIASAIYCLGQPIKMRGVAVLQSGDSLSGFFELLSPTNQLKICKYKEKESDTDWKIFSPKEIRQYQLETGQRFVSKQIDTSHTDSFFIEQIVDGPLRLFYYNIEDVDHYFVEKDSLGLREITKQLRSYKIDGREYISNTNMNNALLCYFTKERPELGDKIRKIRYASRTELSNIVMHYNQEVDGTNSGIILQKKLYKMQVGIQPMGGIIFLSNKYNVKQRTLPNYGLVVNIGCIRHLPNYYFRTGVILSRIENINWYGSGSNYYEWTEKSYLVTIPLEMIYVSPNTFGYYIGGGLNFTVDELVPFIKIAGSAGAKIDLSKRISLRLGGYFAYQGNFILIPERIAYCGINMGLNIMIR